MGVKEWQGSAWQLGVLGCGHDGHTDQQLTSSAVHAHLYTCIQTQLTHNCLFYYLCFALFCIIYF